MGVRAEQGSSLAELLVSMTIALVLGAGLMTLLLENSRLNRSQSLTAEVQANARSTLSLVVQTLRSAGWDPAVAGFAGVALDPDTTDDVDQIEVFADFDADGLTDKDGEQVLIRHTGNRVEWRRTPSGAFLPLAVNISNDADGDGVRELMFTPIPATDPTRIRVQITAESASPDPKTGQPLRHTVSSDVVMRKTI